MGRVRVRYEKSSDEGGDESAGIGLERAQGGDHVGVRMRMVGEWVAVPGGLVNPRLSDYHVPVHADVPPIQIRYLGDPDPTMPAGMYGIGELSICGAPAAVVNAVHHATGRRIRDLPLTPDKVLGLHEM